MKRIAYQIRSWDGFTSNECFGSIFQCCSWNSVMSFCSWKEPYMCFSRLSNAFSREFCSIDFVQE